MLLRRSLAGAIVLLMAASGASFAADRFEIPPPVASRLEAGLPAEVIVLFSDDPAPMPRRGAERERRIAARRAAKEKAVREAGGEILLRYDQLPMVFIRLPDRGSLDRLLARDDVEAVYENRKNYPVLTQSLPLILQDVAAGNGKNGAGVTLAILDTGIDYTRAEFGTCTAPGTPSSCRVIASVDIATSDGLLDKEGHGTKVSMVAAAAAPGAKLAVADVFQPEGWAYDSTVIGGINWAIANADAYGIHVINMSLGDGSGYGSPCSGLYAVPIQNTLDAGILPVAASGNDAHLGGISSPACTPGIVSAGGVYDANVGGVGYGVCTDSSSAADKVACFSNTASYLSILAPGAAITAAGYTSYGTSMASPHVAGAAAVIASAYPGETPAQVSSRLTSGGKLVLDTRTGYSFPRLDMARSLDLYADLSAGASATPEPVVAGSDLTVTLRASNAGPHAAIGTTLSLLIPGGAAVQSTSQGCTTASGKVACAAGTVAPSGNTAAQVVLRPSAAGSLPLSVSAASKTPDPNPANDGFLLASTVAPSGGYPVPALPFPPLAALLVAGWIACRKLSPNIRVSTLAWKAQQFSWRVTCGKLRNRI